MKKTDLPGGQPIKVAIADDHALFRAGVKTALSMKKDVQLIAEADPEATETVKWRKPTRPEGVPVWEHAGLICTGETYKNYVKLTFAHGAALADPAGLFNAGFGGNTRRAIDIREGDTIDAAAFKELVRAAVAWNLAKG